MVWLQDSLSVILEVQPYQTDTMSLSYRISISPDKAICALKDANILNAGSQDILYKAIEIETYCLIDDY